ncbi:MAG: hypothetical protein J5930_01250 [Treponema sp.]|nr:hypothetical protein [Treponema sp.]
MRTPYLDALRRVLVIPGTEDLMPYIPKKTWVVKIVLTVIGYPLLAALLSWVMCLILKI